MKTSGQWDWGQFTFLGVYGSQKGNKEWKKLNKVDEEHIYNPFPTTKYYEDRLNEGGTFVSVQAEEGVSLETAREILYRHGGHSAGPSRTEVSA